MRIREVATSIFTPECARLLLTHVISATKRSSDPTAAEKKESKETQARVAAAPSSSSQAVLSRQRSNLLVPPSETAAHTPSSRHKQGVASPGKERATTPTEESTNEAHTQSIREAVHALASELFARLSDHPLVLVHMPAETDCLAALAHIAATATHALKERELGKKNTIHSAGPGYSHSVSTVNSGRHAVTTSANAVATPVTDNTDGTVLQRNVVHVVARMSVSLPNFQVCSA